MLGSDTAADDGRWTFAQIVEALRAELEGANPHLVVDEDRHRVDLMIDPPTAMSVRRPDMHDADSDAEPYYVGEWWQITWREDAPPKVRVALRATDARAGVGGLVVGRGDGATPAERLRRTRAALDHARSTTAAGFDLSTSALVTLVDELAVRSGWASAAQVAARRDRRIPQRHRRVLRTPAAATEGVIRLPEHDQAPPHDSWTSTTASREESTTASREETPPDAPGRHIVLSSEEFARELSDAGRHRAEDEAAAARIRAEHATAWVRTARLMTWIGLAIVLACLLASCIGLLAGMVWWATFIIVGGGLLFCLLFVVPFWILVRLSPH